MPNRREFVRASGAGAMAAALGGMPLRSEAQRERRRYQVGAYYFPNFHVDSLNEETHGRGWTEWELVKRAEPKFPGHAQPKIPFWGYQDESEPAVFEEKIEAAAGHGLDYFIFDWYWYRDRPFLNGALEKGYLRASNSRRLKFCLMWANHDWINLFPARLHMPFQLQYEGAVTREQFDAVTDYIVKTYFSHPSYWTIDGAPYFSVYELFRLVKGLGGTEATRKALDQFRQKTKAAGFRDLHLNAVMWGVRLLPGTKDVTNPQELLQQLQFDSTTSYTWTHNVQFQGFPTMSYAEYAKQGEAYWTQASEQFQLPYFPNVSMGWDSTPRTCQSDIFTRWDYPFLPAVTGNTPAAFQQGLVRVKNFLDKQPRSAGIFNINAWNEWTEGSYLEPDTQTGYGYLKAIKDVFGVRT